MATVGIDIGGTQLRAAVFDTEMQMLDSFKTPNERGLSAEQNMDKLISFLQNLPYSYDGIGIGCPSPMDIRKGKLLCPPNLVGWDGFELVDYMEKRTGVKTVLNNDANVAGLSEALLGAGSGYESVVFVGISTGIGGAYIYQGKLVNGAHSNAAEFWNMIVNDHPWHHKNANPGSLNEQSSGSGLQHAATVCYGREMKAGELFERYYAGDPDAAAIIDAAANTMAKGIANITCIIDPDVIIIGGSVAIHNSEYVRKIESQAKTYMANPEILHIEMARFGDDAGLVGAALLAAEI